MRRTAASTSNSGSSASGRACRRRCARPRARGSTRRRAPGTRPRRSRRSRAKPQLSAGALPALPRSIDVPAPGHSHVRSQDQLAAQVHQQVFASRSDLLDDTAGDRRVFIDAVQLRKDRLEVAHSLARERLVQRTRGTKDGIALRHPFARGLPAARPGHRQRPRRLRAHPGGSAGPRGRAHCAAGSSPGATARSRPHAGACERAAPPVAVSSRCEPLRSARSPS